MLLPWAATLTGAEQSLRLDVYKDEGEDSGGAEPIGAQSALIESLSDFQAIGWGNAKTVVMTAKTATAEMRFVC